MKSDAALSDFLIIGSGIAGLYAAIRLAEHGTVNIVTKREVQESNTAYAQGGIAAAIAATDSVDAHVEDTLRAGAGLCKREAVESILGDAPAVIQELIRLGVAFTRRSSGELALTQEGGHTARRVAYVDDTTGKEIERALAEAVEAHPNIRIFASHHAVDLILEGRAEGRPAGDPGRDRCLGAFVLEPNSHNVRSFGAAATLLVTGGMGKTYRYTSNPDIATGDGLAMAVRAGARVSNLEFVQFHPTCLYHHMDRSFLITEAARGEGATLTTLDGTRFMQDVDPRGEMASRDIVARTIDAELKRRGDPHVWLRLDHLDAAHTRERFPSIYERCARAGIDITADPIPVVPAAHYMCGGVISNLRAESDLPGLLVAGEVACTGLHGANRLASNSLVEGAVMAARAAESALGVRDRLGAVGQVPAWDAGNAVRVREAIILEHDWNYVRARMWDLVGIVRTDERLEVADERLHGLRLTINSYYQKYLLTPDLVELRNLSMVAQLVVGCARQRLESRGLHYTLDHPDTRPDGDAADTVMGRADLA
jgi:L-aspartate oxidase